ncbi:homocysteine S-methyltransferase family protein [Chloroflexi bacterium TSY]|nr:homocysteine S-methyltransferase family protein [Chloroflexi bacterium TSY]
MTTDLDLTTRLDNGEVFILDGAIGTELERLGAPMHGGIWCAAAIESHPHLVRQVHENYIAAGADIITTNTYASGRHALAKSGLEEKFTEWNTKAVALAHEGREEMAAERPIYLAGSIAPYDNWGKYDARSIRASYREQAELLANADVDLLILEMLGTDADNTVIAIEETSQTGLPIWVSLSCLDQPSSNSLYLGVRENSAAASQFNRGFEPFDAAIQRIMAVGGSVLSMMHSEIHLAQAALSVMRENFAGPLGVYPNAGYWQRPNWTFIEGISPEFYCTEAQKWIDSGAQVVGGCCGIGPEYIRAIHDGLRLQARPQKVIQST